MPLARKIVRFYWLQLGIICKSGCVGCKIKVAREELESCRVDAWKFSRSLFGTMILPFSFPRKGFNPSNVTNGSLRCYTLRPSRNFKGKVVLSTFFLCVITTLRTKLVRWTHLNVRLLLDLYTCLFLSSWRFSSSAVFDFFVLCGTITMVNCIKGHSTWCHLMLASVWKKNVKRIQRYVDSFLFSWNQFLFFGGGYFTTFDFLLCIYSKYLQCFLVLELIVWHVGGGL